MDKSNNKNSREDDRPLERGIRVNEEAPGFSSRDEIQEMRLESQVQRLSTRLIVVSIVIPCLLGAVMAFIYYQFNNRFNNLLVTGEGQVEALSEDVGDRIEALAKQHGKFEKSFSDRITSVDKNFKKDRKEINWLASSKAGKKALGQAKKKQASELTSSINLLRSELQGHKGAVEKLGETLNKEVGEISKLIKGMEKSQKQQDIDINGLSKNKLGIKEFREILEKKWSGYELKISLLKKEVKAFQEEIALLKKQLGKAIIRSALPKSGGTYQKEKTNGGALTRTPGKIVEQEIGE